MKVALMIAILFILIPTALAAPTGFFENVTDIESSYNVQTLMTKDYTYVILTTESPGECEYGMEEFKYGEGEKFEDNGTVHKAKIKLEEGKSYQLKIKCVIQGKSGEEDIMFSISHITFFLLENLEELRNDITDFRKRLEKYESRVDTEDIKLKIMELENIVKNSENFIKTNDVNKLRLEISKGIRKKNEIERDFVIKSIQLSIMEKSKYVILLIIVSYLTIYFLANFFIPYYRIKKNLRKMKEREREMVNLRKNTENLYFNRKIDEDTFNKMVLKEQEEVMKIRVKISSLEERKSALLKNLLKPRTIIEWSLKERIHFKDFIRKIKNKYNKIKG